MEFYKKAARGVSKIIPVKPFRLRNRRGVISFTFDDFWGSAAEIANPLLRKHEIRATYYVSGSLMEVKASDGGLFRVEQLASIMKSGHEIGCHTFSHQSCQNLTLDELKFDWDKNAKFLSQQAGITELHSFAYPYGVSTLGAKRAAAQRFATARSTQSGINSGWIDLGHLRANRVYSSSDRNGLRARCDLLIREAAKIGGWLIFYTHDVSETPSKVGCYPEDFDYILTSARKADCEVLPIRNALGFISVVPW